MVPNYSLWGTNDQSVPESSSYIGRLNGDGIANSQAIIIAHQKTL
jgi:hypothetical protein